MLEAKPPRMTETEQLLRRLTANDDASLRSVLAPTPEFTTDFSSSAGPQLDRRLRSLVRLAALLALNAPTTSVCWAVELASSAGLQDGELVAVLLAVGSAAHAAQVEFSASSLVFAFDHSSAGSSLSEESGRTRPGNRV